MTPVSPPPPEQDTMPPPEQVAPSEVPSERAIDLSVLQSSSADNPEIPRSAIPPGKLPFLERPPLPFTELERMD